MPDFLSSRIPFAISKAKEATYNTPLEPIAGYEGAVTQQMGFQPPSMDSVFDEGLIGPQNEFATDAVSEWVTHPTMPIQDRLNTQQFFKLAHRHMGFVTSALVATETVVWDHIIEFINDDTDIQLPGTSLMIAYAGIEAVFAGMVGNSLSITQSGATAPMYSNDLVGTGKSTALSALVPALTRTSIPAAPAQNYMIGSVTKVTMDDGSLLDLTAERRFQGFNLQINNNPILNDRRATGGDNMLTPNDFSSGAFVDRIERDRRTVTCSINVFCTNAKREYTDMLNGVTISNLSFLARGKKIGATTKNHEVEVTIPKSRIRATQTGDDQGRLTYSLEIVPLKLVGDKGPVKIRVRNGLATAST